MPLASPDLSIPLRDAIIASASVMDLLPTYLDSDNVFTRRPIPPDAPYPMIVVNPDISNMDRGGLNDQHRFVMRDVAVYGQNATPDQYRAVETTAFAVFDLFHRQRSSIVVPNWHVINLWASGPSPAPTDDDMTVGRIVELRIELIAAM
jgi:hypothetical protein